jgi:hypothetical protein
LTYSTVHAKQRSQVLREIGILHNVKDIAVHDDYVSYFQFPDVLDSLFNAYHLWELKFIEERYPQE